MSDPCLSASRSCYESPRFSLYEEDFATPDGMVRRPIIHHPGAVAILAQPQPESLLLVRQYRYAIRRWTLEIPAGTREPGEEALATAQRELSEEAGLAARQWKLLTCFYPAVGVSDEAMLLYQARELFPSSSPADHGELIGPEEVSFAQIKELHRSGQICDAKTLLALALVAPTVFAEIHPC